MRAACRKDWTIRKGRIWGGLCSQGGRRCREKDRNGKFGEKRSCWMVMRKDASTKSGPRL